MSLCSYIPMANVLGVEKMEPRCDIDSQLHQHGRRYGGVRFVPAALMVACLMGRALLWARAFADAMLVAEIEQRAQSAAAEILEYEANLPHPWHAHGASAIEAADVWMAKALK